MLRPFKLLLLFCLVSISGAQVYVNVFEADGNTPFDGRTIMVGTKLTIIVDSNVAQYWGGDLAIADSNTAYGLLTGRNFGYNDVTMQMEWMGSHLPAAGLIANVFDWGIEIGVNGYQLDPDPETLYPGKWFIIDYTATAPGTCRVGVYDHDFSWDIPLYYLPSFTHVITRDLNFDGQVDFVDFAILASFLGQQNCVSPLWCGGADLDTNGHIDSKDLALFAEYWLERTSY